MTQQQPFHALENATDRPPIVAVDLGYSARKRSCGIAWTGCEEPVERQFGEAIKETRDVLKALDWRAVLVVEAVLSTYHQQNGNPDIRGRFERGRGWYYGAGVLSFGAALRFLSVLAGGLPEGVVVPLAEAFLSNKDTPSGHGEDALTIRNQFWNNQPKQLRDGV